MSAEDSVLQEFTKNAAYLYIWDTRRREDKNDIRLFPLWLHALNDTAVSLGYADFETAVAAPDLRDPTRLAPLAQAEAARREKEAPARLARAEAARLAQEKAARLAEAEVARLAQEEAARLDKVKAARHKQAEAARLEKAKAARLEKAKAARHKQAQAARLALAEAARLKEAQAAEDNRIQFLEAIPILRIFDEAKAREFYCDFLGFKASFEHRLETDLPLYMEVARAGLKLHLSGHYGDATPGSNVFIPTKDVHALHTELTEKKYGYGRPEIQKTLWGEVLEVVDPFGNRLRFCAATSS